MDPDRLDGKIDFNVIFGRPGVVHIEIGSGKGSFLLSQALQNPHINYIGVEWAKKYYRFCIDRFGRRAINNIRMVRADAKDFISNRIPDSSISCFHVYFPDPWPKTRHHKRRFLSESNIPALYKCLITGGSVRFVTDDANYFESSCYLFQNSGFYWEFSDLFPLPGTPFGQIVGTNYEQKYRKEGRPVFGIEFRKRACIPIDEYCPMRDLLNPSFKSSDKIFHQS